MNDNLPNNAVPPDEELVAYLDGELDAGAVRRIEALLASDPEVRRRLQSLERTWDLLDELDESPVGEPFTRSTLEMVAIAAREDLQRTRSEEPRRRWRRFLAFFALPALAAVAGFLAVFAILPDPNRSLLENLPLLENLEEYRQVQSIEFLRKLRDAGLFTGEVNGQPDLSRAGGISDPRGRIEAMSLEAKRELQRSVERFSGLTPDEQRQLRQLRADLLADPDAERLQRIAREYCEWLKGLSSYSQAELAGLAPEVRAASVKKRLEAERIREGGKRPGAKDLEAMRKWLVAYVATHEGKIMASLPEQQRNRISEFKDAHVRRYMILAQLGQRWKPAEPGKPPAMITEMTEVDLATLRNQLSRETQSRLEGRPPPEQWRLVAGWIRQGWRRPIDVHRPSGPMSRDDDERLAVFFEKELSDEERDRLLTMPGEDMQRELHRLFLNRVRLPGGPGRHFDGGRRNNRPGDVRP